MDTDNIVEPVKTILVTFKTRVKYLLYSIYIFILVSVNEASFQLWYVLDVTQIK